MKTRLLLGLVLLSWVARAAAQPAAPTWKFDFGPGRAAPGYRQVSATASTPA